MNGIVVFLIVFWIPILSAVSHQRLPSDEEAKQLRIVEDEKRPLLERADAVDTLAKGSAISSAPRLLKMLNERHSYADVLDHRILIFLQMFPTAEAVPELLKYEEYARQQNIEMASKIGVAFKKALEECKKQEKKK